MKGPLYIHEAMRGIGHGIGAEGARMVPKWGNRGKLARIAKRAIECDGVLQQYYTL